VYLVTGTNRGVGLAFVRLLTTRPDVIVYATARKLDGAAELRALADGSEGKVRLLELSYGDEESNAAAAARIKKEVGRLDVVIANAGKASCLGDVPCDGAYAYFAQASSVILVNTIGPLVLFKAVYPLLNASRGKFIVISSALGAEMGANTPIGFTAYGTSKAAVNFLVRRINAECPDISKWIVC
ncbi:NAD(P)-binding protein, partial [Schizophyllum commune Tattone D]